VHNIRLWDLEASSHLERFFSPLFLLAPAAAASEPTPGQPAELLRARKRRHAAALAEPIPGQLLVLDVVVFCKKFCVRELVARPRNEQRGAAGGTKAIGSPPTPAGHFFF
jgi:hypothetical protein